MTGSTPRQIAYREAGGGILDPLFPDEPITSILIRILSLAYQENSLIHFHDWFFGKASQGMNYESSVTSGWKPDPPLASRMRRVAY